MCCLFDCYVSSHLLIYGFFAFRYSSASSSMGIYDNGSLLQIWDDKSSANLPGPLRLLVGAGGMMGTHDELTRAYFQARA